MNPAPSFAGPPAIVTGASRGIGRAVALRLGHDGARVIPGRDVTALGMARDQIGNEAGAADMIPLDRAHRN